MTGDIERRVERLESIAEGQQAQVGLLTSIAERQQASLEHLGDLLEEVRRDTAQTRRLWVRLAQRYGWLEDGDPE